MLHKIFSFGGAAVMLLLFLTGCSDDTPPDPPLARAELTTRLYDTLQQGRNEEALVIIDKLLALDSNDADLLEMRDRIISNTCGTAMQKKIDQGKLDEALQTVRQYRKQYPMMPALRIYESEVSDLIKLRNASADLANASDIASLAAALEKIAPLATKYPEAKQLHADIKIRRSDLAKMRSQAAAAADQNKK